MAGRSLSGDDNRVRPIVAVWISNLETGVRERIYALLDTGADWDFVSLKVGRRLGLAFSDCDPNMREKGIWPIFSLNPWTEVMRAT